jgi:hypothetical protein
MGKTWKEVSPDLTRNEKEKQGKGGGPYTNEAVGAENYGTISYVVESPHEKGVIWTGSDDGYGAYLTTDGGNNWKNVTPGGPSECLINAIEVSPHDKATAYIATTRYKFNDHAPGTLQNHRLRQDLDQNHHMACLPMLSRRVVREDAERKDLLFAGTELGLFISWNGGKVWSPFQLNLPVAPITDLKIHQGDLIAATSGRSFWILDDLALLRQYQQPPTTLTLYQPENAYLANGGSELNRSDESFTGAGTFEGVNPANGIVWYYYLPGDKKDVPVSLEIRDASGNIVRTVSSKKDSLYKQWDGGPSEDPSLTAGKGLNRFVWDMRYPTMNGIEDVYIEAGYRGHKAAPGKYTATLKWGETQTTATAEILANPQYPTDATTYREYHQLMLQMEEDLRSMHRWVNQVYAKRQQLEKLLTKLPAEASFNTIRKEGEALVQKMKAWDEDMVQRKSKAYDDVENFPNKFTANYLFLINQTESDIPRVNQPSLDVKKVLDAEWVVLKDRAAAILVRDLPALNQQLWEAGVGGIWEE